MQKLTITNKQQLADWLTNFNWFLIGKILDVSAKPSQLGDKEALVPDTVTFQLEKTDFLTVKLPAATASSLPNNGLSP